MMMKTAALTVGGIRITENLPLGLFELLCRLYGYTFDIHDGKVAAVERESEDMCPFCRYNTNSFVCHPNCGGCDGKSHFEKGAVAKWLESESRKSPC